MHRIHFILFFMLIVFLMPAWPIERAGNLSTSETWSVADSPVTITGNLTIATGVKVTVEPGVEIRLGRGVVVTVRGELDAQGTSEAMIHFVPSGQDRWGALSFEGNGVGTLRYCSFDRGSNGSSGRVGMVNAYRCTGMVLIEHCSFTRWPDDFNNKATHGDNSAHMVIRHCYFGPGVNEGVHGTGTPIIVEYCTFDIRRGYSDAIDIGNIQLPNPRSMIRFNTILGSDDDGIDLDDCDAWVEGNWVQNCRGGNNDPIGISGDRDSKPIIVNNIVVNCESGIAFKNGANITLINNTIVNCDKGIWMHQNPAHATIINTIIWGRPDQTSIRLERNHTVDVSYSIVRGDEIYPGVGNLNTDPLFEDMERFTLQMNSPAIDAGTGGENVPEIDYYGSLREDHPLIANQGSGNPDYIDIGAVEYHSAVNSVLDWQLQ